MAHDEQTILRSLQYLMPSGTVLELRGINARYQSGYIVKSDFKMIMSGWYERAHDLMVDATKARGVSVFVTHNPVDPALLGRSDHKFVRTTHATKGEDILALRWAFVDIDPKRKADTSATDAERSLALGRRDTILAGIPGLAECSLTGSSGNGGYILARIGDLPNTQENLDLIATALRIIALDHDGNGVEIDQKTKDASRICTVPGTEKTKGSNRPTQPWRTSTLDGVPSEGAVWDIAAFVAEHADRLPKGGTRTSVAPRSSLPAVASRGDSAPFAGLGELAEKTYRASRYLGSVAPAVAGQSGHAQTFDAACALVKGYGFSPSEALPLLAEWNQRCDPPWEAHDLEHKLADADAKPDDKERGYLFRANREGYQRTEIILSPPTGNVPPAPNGQPDDDGDMDAAGQEENPDRLSREFLRQFHNHADGNSIRYWNGEFHAWVGGRYVPIPKDEIHADLTSMMEQEFFRIYNNQMQAQRAGGGEVGENGRPRAIKLIPVTTNLVGHVYNAVRGKVVLHQTKNPKQPCWVGGSTDWPADEILPMRNTIVHLPSFLAGQPCTLRPTPNLFCPYVLTYDWQPDAPAPAKWLRFLDDVFPGDQESIDALQEWFGLQLVPVTSYQKMFAFIGPPGAGKGVISSIMREMVGESNCCGPTLGSLSDPFGLQNLVGKLTAIIDDARLSGRSDQATIMERLLSISGEGTLDVNRKNRPYWSGVLTCRITLISNELPRLNDNSNALARRFIVLRFTKSHVGHEDSTLKGQFVRELPGILLWAAVGLKRLTERGHFNQPASGDEIHEEMKEISSPIGCFVRDCCHVAEEETVEKSAIFQAWKQWCEVNNRKEVGEMNVFARNLRSVVPSLKASQPRDGGRRLSVYKGIGLLPPESLVTPNESGLASEVDWTLGD